MPLLELLNLEDKPIVDVMDGNEGIETSTSLGVKISGPLRCHYMSF
jgi:hypothetical protein